MAWDGRGYKQPSPDEIRARLTEEQFRVTQEEGT